jgi:RND superfamily putative drug exporter
MTTTAEEPRMSRPNIAARAARWSAEHARRATVAWLLVVVAAVVLGTALGTRTLTDVDHRRVLAVLAYLRA